eukprot:GHUV01024613.1.p1 GENE.GHUV01024613.1~~GHUV01024613.1.p1  ORF type:complete len:111 (-),score=25.23 GHUV01024613.1:736-1068(-)
MMRCFLDSLVSWLDSMGRSAAKMVSSSSLGLSPCCSCSTAPSTASVALRLPPAVCLPLLKRGLPLRQEVGLLAGKKSVTRLSFTTAPFAAGAASSCFLLVPVCSCSWLLW